MKGIRKLLPILDLTFYSLFTAVRNATNRAINIMRWEFAALLYADAVGILPTLEQHHTIGVLVTAQVS